MWEWLDSLFDASEYVGDLPLADAGDAAFDVGDIGGQVSEGFYNLSDFAPSGGGDFVGDLPLADFGDSGFDVGDIGGQVPESFYTPASITPDAYAAPESAAAPTGYQMPKAYDPTLVKEPGDAGSPITRAATAVGDAAKKIGAAAGKNPMQAALGLGAIGSVGAGLMKGSSQPQLSPATKAALDAMTAQRQRASAAAETGYAGEQAIRDKVNNQILAALDGEGSDETLMPDLVRARDNDLRTLEDRLRMELGPGFATSTAGQNALSNRALMWEDRFTTEREKRLATRNSMGAQRTQISRQMDLDPFNMAQAELGTLAQFDESAANRDAAERNALLGLGGNLAGYAAAPWMYEQMRRNYAKVN